MKDKVVITRENYRQIMLKRAIISCWVILVVCFIIKLFGGNFFAIVCNNERFIKVCEFVDNSIIRYLLYYILFIFDTTLIIKIVEPNIKIKSSKFLINIIIWSIIWLYKFYIEIFAVNINLWIIDIIDFIVLFLILYINSKKIIRPIISIALLFIFTLISALTKDIGINGVITESYLITIIFRIDYYIMLIITMLYSKKLKKGELTMGLSGWFHWLGEEVDKLEAIKALTKDEEVIKAIDKRIAELEELKEEK